MQLRRWCLGIAARRLAQGSDYNRILTMKITNIYVSADEIVSGVRNYETLRDQVASEAPHEFRYFLRHLQACIRRVRRDTSERGLRDELDRVYHRAETDIAGL